MRMPRQLVRPSFDLTNTGTGRQASLGSGAMVSTASTIFSSNNRSAIRVVIPVHWAPGSGFLNDAR